MNAEDRRLEEDRTRVLNWKRWGPYLSQRQWGTVREDYSPDGNSWTYFPHEDARSRAYRWGEDGLLGICDRECRLAFALCLWNERDPILKERLYGLSNPQGNHGEDVKEYYFFTDSTPTHSYMKALYKYPQAEFPYSRLIEENARRDRSQPEFELVDTGIFRENRYFDVVVEYAKNSPNDILIRVTLINRGPESCILHFLPTAWFRNTWAWGRSGEGYWDRPSMRQAADGKIELQHCSLGEFFLEADRAGDAAPELVFTENETNTRKLFHSPSRSSFVKDAFHELIIENRRAAVNPDRTGTKAAAWYRFDVSPASPVTVKLRLYGKDEAPRQTFGGAFDSVFDARIREADEFYRNCSEGLSEPETRIQRQAYAGLHWSKQFYNYVVRDWLEGDPSQPAPPAERWNGRNSDWLNLYNREVITVPDTWEYPWYAAWDLAFQAVAFSKIDPDFAKQQLLLLTREWYMHPKGQMPAYEYGFSDVDPPVHAWACWHVYQNSAPAGSRDRTFLAGAFLKLLLNFAWWVNRKDVNGLNIFSGGFLGLDNIGVFDRSKPLPEGGYLQQSDGTAWVAFYASMMLTIALELSRTDPAYEDIASKFFEYYISVADAMNTVGGNGLWDEQDGFYYDQALIAGRMFPLRVRSLVGLIPLLGVQVLDGAQLSGMRGFSQRMDWFVNNRSRLVSRISYLTRCDTPRRQERLLAIPTRERLERVLRYMLSEDEFLSPFGIRSLSRYYLDHPYVLSLDGDEHRVEYNPAESDSPMFGGNSNWRGPIWFPLNYLLIEALGRYHQFFGDTLRVECPTGSGKRMNLAEVATELARRLASLFEPDSTGVAPWQRQDPQIWQDPHWRDHTLFYEYFHADTGRGCGASHQTGWTALIARVLEHLAASRG